MVFVIQSFVSLDLKWRVLSDYQLVFNGSERAVMTSLLTSAHVPTLQPPGHLLVAEPTIIFIPVHFGSWSGPSLQSPLFILSLKINFRTISPNVSSFEKPFPKPQVCLHFLSSMVIQNFVHASMADRPGIKSSSFHILVLPWTSFVTMGKWPNFS